MKRQRIVLLLVFSIAMGFLEAAVVVYLRTLFYPQGFTVALQVNDPQILKVELVRELATVIMLVCVGAMSGKNGRERFAFFLVAFAVWDITYYAGLKLFLDWPSSLMEWDILFLFPITWLGPVLAPILCAVTMIMLGWVLLRRPHDQLSALTWVFLLSGTLLILYSFIRDYAALMTEYGLWPDYFSLLSNRTFLRVSAAYLPVSFAWYVFCGGEILIVAAIVNVLRRRPACAQPP